MSIKHLAGVVALGATGLAAMAMAPGVSAAADSTQVCEGSVTFRVYFDPESSRIDSEGRELIGMAMEDVQGCGATDVAFAADPRAINAADARRHTSERSVAVLNTLRDQGFDGSVFVKELAENVVAAERNVGPDYVEVTLAPRGGSRLYASNDAR